MDSFRALGIDVELEDGLDPRVWPHVLTSEELDRVHGLPICKRATEVKTIWCAKEATIKAFGCRLEPTAINTTPDNASGSHKVVALSNPSHVCQARTARVSGCILAAVALPQDVQLRAGIIR
jgi:4'-phosphopantetheinyl transferase EntD